VSGVRCGEAVRWWWWGGVIGLEGKGENDKIKMWDHDARDAMQAAMLYRLDTGR